MKHTVQVLTVSVLLASLLSACGGGGDSSPSVEPIKPTTPATAIPESLSIKAAASADVGSAANFDNSASTLTGLKFAWSFGDGTSSAEASPKHEYAKVGDYDVTLKVSNEEGASKELKFRVSVNNRAHVKGLACTGAADSGWCWQQPKPSGNSQSEIFFLDAKTAWSVGEQGEIFKTVDGGKTWAKQNTGLRSPLLSVKFIDANNGWAVGSLGAVLRTTDGGANWIQQASWLKFDSYWQGSPSSLRVISPSTVMVTMDDYLSVSTDGGASWVQNSVRPSLIGLDGTVWIQSYDKLFKSTDFGKTSKEVFSSSKGLSAQPILLGSSGILLTRINSVWDSNAGQYRTTTEFVRSQDAGANWETFEAKGLPTTEYLYFNRIEFTDASNGLLSAGNSALYRTSDGGRNWVAVQLPALGNAYQNDLRILTGGKIYRQVSSSAGVEHNFSEDGGQTWRKIAVPKGQYGLGDPKQLGEKSWLLQSNGSSFYLSSDGMLTWTLIAGPDAETMQRSFRATWFFDAKRGLALNAAGELQETLNGGLSWQVKLKDLVSPQYGDTRFQFTSASKGWLLAGDGKVYRSDDGGASWSAPLSSSRRISAFHFVDDKNGFAVSSEYSVEDNADKPVILASTDGGQSWAKSGRFVPNISSIQFSSALKGVAVGAGGRIAVTDDGGKTWANRFTGVSADLNRVLYADAKTIWVVGDRGVVLQSLDGGANWVLAQQGDATDLQDIQFLDAQRGWIVGTQGAMLATQDGGKSWQRVYTGTQKKLNKVFFVDPRTGWVAGEDGSLLATGTGGI
ncbi:YCF48-related protein [Paucibacter sp. Y2R2-4]|uniref:YCF48-related protein n=1 Tax=Paucibacter sp. Y2R2-4 TaxID=2893553 RepID=UPI0021E429A5|nr:YCF48-related protein [Paucibacter sp. Y2R2-4]MCV2350588.1 YCF48-related protein [Paucibacter sp. Y2R2-4]